MPGGAYPCPPGGLNDYVYIYTQPVNPEMWRQFAVAIGRADLLTDPRCTDAPTRWQHRDELNAIIRAWTGTHEVRRDDHSRHGGRTVRRRAGYGRGAGRPALNARGAITTIDHPVRGRFRLPSCPVRLSASEATTTPAPLVGQHTVEVLAEVLALSKEEVVALQQRGVVG